MELIDTTIFNNMPSSKYQVVYRLITSIVYSNISDIVTYSPIIGLVLKTTNYLKNDKFNFETIFEYNINKDKNSL